MTDSPCMLEREQVSIVERTSAAIPTTKPPASIASTQISSSPEDVFESNTAGGVGTVSTASNVLSASSKEPLALSRTSSILDETPKPNNITLYDAPQSKSEPISFFVLPLPTPAQLGTLFQTTLDQPKNTRKDRTLKSPKHKTLVRPLPIYAPLLRLPTKDDLTSSMTTRAHWRKKHVVRKTKLTRRSMRTSVVAAPASLVKSFLCVSESSHSEDFILGVPSANEVAESMVIGARLESQVPMDVAADVDVISALTMEVDEKAQSLNAQVAVEIATLDLDATLLAAPALVTRPPMDIPAETVMGVSSDPAPKFPVPAPRASAFPPDSVLPHEAHGMPCKPINVVSSFGSQKPKSVQPDPDAKLATAPTRPGACRTLGRVEATRIVVQKQVVWSLDKEGKEAVPEKGVPANTYIWRRDPALGTPAVRVRAPKQLLVQE